MTGARSSTGLVMSFSSRVEWYARRHLIPTSQCCRCTLIPDVSRQPTYLGRSLFVWMVPAWLLAWLSQSLESLYLSAVYARLRCTHPSVSRAVTL